MKTTLRESMNEQMLTSEDLAIILVVVLWIHDHRLDLPDWTPKEVDRLMQIAQKIKASDSCSTSTKLNADQLEKLADDLGHAIFRLETNFTTLLRRTPEPDAAGKQATAAMFDDLEKLKAIKSYLANLPTMEKLQAVQEWAESLPVKELARACELIIAVKHCMMLDHVHADWLVKETLDKYGAASVQLLAKQAQDTAEHAMETWNQSKKK
jgi:hypothetical protein